MLDATTDLPAIAGGTPAKHTPFQKASRYGAEELAHLEEALQQGTLFYAHGKKVAELEKQFAAKIGAKHAIASSSGTAAIHIAMIALGVSPGDEVIVPPITDIGSIVPILWQGAIPVFADLDPHTYNLSPQAVRDRISDRTRAVLAVHLAGNACDLGEIKKLCDKQGATPSPCTHGEGAFLSSSAAEEPSPLPSPLSTRERDNAHAISAVCRQHPIALIEDCAQSHGCTYAGKSVGTFGAIGCFSFNEFKHISCGDGGVCVTDDDALARKLRLASDKCYDRSPDALDRNATFLAANYRMTELQAAVAIAQLGKLDSIVARRRSWCGRLHERLAGIAGLSLPKTTEGCEHSWWFYMMLVDAIAFHASADEFGAALKAEGVPCNAHYIGKPIQEYPLFQHHSAFARGEHPFSRRDYSKESTPIAKQILESCVTLHINESYSDQDLEETVLAIKKVANWFARK